MLRRHLSIPLMLSGLVVGTTFIVLLYNVHIYYYYYDGPLYKPQVNEYSRIASNSKHESTSLLEEVDIDSKSTGSKHESTTPLDKVDMDTRSKHEMISPLEEVEIDSKSTGSKHETTSLLVKDSKSTGSKHETTSLLEKDSNSTGSKHETTSLLVKDSQSTVSEHETTSPLEEEVRIVSSRIRDCLTATNMSDYFITNNYMTTAGHNARQVLESLRKIIPRFESEYDLPCWKMSLEVTLKSKPAKWGTPVSSNIVEGFIDGMKFSHKDRLDRTMRTLYFTHWSGNPPHISLSTVCLPKIFLLGYPKCGSTLLFCLIRNILSLKFNVQDNCQLLKEPHWWSGDKVKSTSFGYLSVYLLNFETGSDFVNRNMPAVTIDGSRDLMYESPRYSEDETMENYCLMPSLIPVILPDSKYFVIMRNPVTMLYSAFWFSCTIQDLKVVNSVKYQGPDIFHERIIKKITMFNNCKDQGIHLDKCVNMVGADLYTPVLPKCGRTRLMMGLYYFHTRKWLSVVPRERIHFFTMEELATQDITHTAKVILDHLELNSTKREMNDFQKIICAENAQHSIDYKHDPRLKMREDTKQILEEFFQPYNKMLADLLGDDKFLWQKRA